MAPFVLTVQSPSTVAEAWRRITDWTSHGRFVPFTTTTVDPPGTSGVGTLYTARTSLGRLGFDDPMEIVRWNPPADGGPGRCRLEKRGRVMLGWAEITVEPAAAGSAVTWHEDIAVHRLPKVFDPVVVLSSRLLFGRVLRKLLAG